MRSRQNVVIARLNDEELKTYNSILKRANRMMGYTPNKSQQFRNAIKIMKGYIVDENHMLYHDYVSDFR